MLQLLLYFIVKDAQVLSYEIHYLQILLVINLTDSHFSGLPLQQILHGETSINIVP